MIEFKNVSFEIKGLTNNKVKLLDNVSFEVEKGTKFGIAGQSGAGKTTIAKLLSGVYKSYTGTITIFDTELNEYLKSRKLQILFQNNNELINPLRTIHDVIEEVLKLRKAANIESAIKYLINLMKLPENVIDKKGYELSGGQQQRAAFARILAAKPEVIIMDEPFSAQDAESQNIISDLIIELNKELKLTFIIISHDLDLMERITDKLLIIKHGKIIEQGDTKEVLLNPKDPHTKFLVHSKNYDLDESELAEGL